MYKLILAMFIVGFFAVAAEAQQGATKKKDGPNDPSSQQQKNEIQQNKDQKPQGLLGQKGNPYHNIKDSSYIPSRK